MSEPRRSQWPICQVRGCEGDATTVVEDGYWLCADHVAIRSGVTGTNVATIATRDEAAR